MWLPDDCIKIIDTHDLFGGRAEKFTSIGRKPEWYYTSVEEETRGLDRADFVVAIQSDEALELKERTRSEVVEVGYLLPPSPVRRRRAEDDDAISLGYIGSANPFNVASVSHFCEVLSGRTLPQDVRLLASGSICDLLKTMPRQPFTLLGRVKHLDEFYESIDVAINPMTGGTGLKIKTIEALSHGVAVVGTAEAFAASRRRKKPISSLPSRAWSITCRVFPATRRRCRNCARNRSGCLMITPTCIRDIS